MQRRVVAVGAAAAVVIASLTVAATAVSDRAGEAQRTAGSTTTTTAPRRPPGERTAPADVDGDGTSDLVVYRPATGTFWIDGSRDGQQAVVLGQPGDVPTVGDFDGDGRADLAVVTPGVGTGTGSWTIRSSADGKVTTLAFGLEGDVPEPADYDGDGRDDVAVFRPASAAEGEGGETTSATWFVRRSGAADPSELLVVPFGVAGDQPAPADYDGDGTADLAVQRVDTRWIRRSSDGETEAVSWGQAWDQPVVLDLDGDGRAEVAVLRRVDGALRWYIRPEGDDDATILEFGRALEPDQQHLVGDFDGDGRSEPAVFEPATGSFWIWQPDGARVESWGEPGDVALP
ncbi:MAG: VCBS repeat-containing protein [Actinobacteria bacterium]|nr:VCBS repeat-containing protein [Actinomycetota bacterium]